MLTLDYIIIIIRLSTYVGPANTWVHCHDLNRYGDNILKRAD